MELSIVILYNFDIGKIDFGVKNFVSYTKICLFFSNETCSHMSSKISCTWTSMTKPPSSSKSTQILHIWKEIKFGSYMYIWMNNKQKCQWCQDDLWNTCKYKTTMNIRVWYKRWQSKGINVQDFFSPSIRPRKSWIQSKDTRAWWIFVWIDLQCRSRKQSRSWTGMHR